VGLSRGHNNFDKFCQNCKLLLLAFNPRDLYCWEYSKNL